MAINRLINKVFCAGAWSVMVVRSVEGGEDTSKSHIRLGAVSLVGLVW